MNIGTPIQQIQTNAQHTFDLILKRSREPFPFQTPSLPENGEWIPGLTSLEVKYFVFDKTEKNLNI